MNVSVFLAIALVPFVQSAITEISLPLDVHQCFEQELARSNISMTIGEVIFSKCVHKTLWVQPTVRQPTTSIGNDARDWISGLVQMDLHYFDTFPGANPKTHSRHRRQSSFSGGFPAGRRGNGDRPADGSFPSDGRMDGRLPTGQRSERQHSSPDRGLSGQFLSDMGLDGQIPSNFGLDGQLPADRRADGTMPSGRRMEGQLPADRRDERLPSNRRQTLRRQPRVRKEYRMLTDRERQLFHRAVNMLKTDTSVYPNKFDALARLHYMSIGRSHYGPNFLPWHRLFLVVMENALREKIPSVTIPYWDSTLDDGLLDFRSSIIWTPEFLGEANGYVENGPFASWNTQTGPLIRYFGSGGTVMNWTYIYNVLRQDHLENITDPYALPENNLELQHTQVHRWVGGHMAPPALAAFDPVFYLLHSYVDLLWEIFRGLQKRRGIDPTTDYPRNITEIPDGQRYDDPSGFGSLLNRHGLSNVFTDNIYKYDRPPSCTIQNPDCGSDYLRCDTSGSQPKCVSASIFDIKPIFLSSGLPAAGGSGIREFRRKRDTHHNTKGNNSDIMEMVNRASDFQCQSNNINEKYVNTYNIDGIMDKQNWVYIPTRVVYTNINANRTQSSMETVYDICKRGNSNIPNRIFTETNGINYVGMFKEISHFPNDISTSSALAAVGVRRPTANSPSDILVTAYDECGNICQPYCLDSSRTKRRKCPGAIRITADTPQMYGIDNSNALNRIWREDINGLPYVDESEIFITLVCDRSTSYWPW
ncbi:hypothetical protein ACF0H5_021410 [Mactra antiquata]